MRLAFAPVGVSLLLQIRVYFIPLGFAALAKPLPLVPLSPPRAAPPLPAGAAPPLPALILEAGAGVENFEAFEDVGGFSTKDVSVVL